MLNARQMKRKHQPLVLPVIHEDRHAPRRPERGWIFKQIRGNMSVGVETRTSDKPLHAWSACPLDWRRAETAESDIGIPISERTHLAVRLRPDDYCLSGFRGQGRGRTVLSRAKA